MIALVLIAITSMFFGNQGYTSPSSTYATVETPNPAQSPGPDRLATIIAQGTPSAVAQGAPAITLPVTEAKVRQYVEQTITGVGGGVVAQNAQVVTIQFMTVALLRPLTNNAFLDSYLAEEPVVYVTFTGDFAFWDPDGVKSTYHSAYRVFSVRTGNELVAGVVP